MSLVSLPDLSRMQSVTNVNEVDISKIKKAQHVKVKLDAFPEKEFLATVATVGTMGQPKDQTNVKSFEVVVDIQGADPVLKPGMTTSNEIVMSSISDTLFVPLESVFEKDGKTIVYKMHGSTPRQQEVSVGEKNGNFIIVASGLQPGDKVTLRDPTVEERKTGDSRPKSGTTL
jgi:hypothetical protein